jgi:AraC family transcriptional regulator of adaptative response / DNA-3-methyladenine glycosylase II
MCVAGSKAKSSFAGIGLDPGAGGGRKRRSGNGGESVITPAIYLQAIYSRDPRFDGRFFLGAITTGLYCRNICPVPFAEPKNILLFECASAAESAGFCPCKRCQPQAAPGTPAWLGTSAVVNRAFHLILDGALNEGSVEELAERLGLGARQLRRLFVQRLGISPLKMATTFRLHLARKLITESKLPMTQIAFCSGFKSIREFNHAFRLSACQSPSELRRTSGASQLGSRTGSLEIRLPYRKPFDWTSLILFLRNRAVPGVELVTLDSYQRLIEVSGASGILTVRPDKTGPRLVVRLELPNYERLVQTVERIRCIFDLSADPIQIASHLSADPDLRQLLKLRPGLRVPGVWDGFEVAVLAVLGQKLTEPGSMKQIARLVEVFGRPINTSIQGLNYLFPRPEILARADLSKAGISDRLAIVLRKLARATVGRRLRFSTLQTLEQIVSQLGETCGIDPSTANYIAMRAFGEPDAFPARELVHRLSLEERPRPSTEVMRGADEWRPWRAYAAMHLAQCADQPRGLRRPSFVPQGPGVPTVVRERKRWQRLVIPV